MVTTKASAREKQDGIYACSWEKLKGKTPMRLQMECRECSANAPEEQLKIGLNTYPSTEATTPLHGNINQPWRQGHCHRAMKRDGGEVKPNGEETPRKKRVVLFTDEKTIEKAKAFPSTSSPAGQPNPITPILSSLRSPSAPSRPREEFELLEEESPMKKLRPSDGSSKKAKINMVKVGGEDLYFTM